MFDGMSRDFGMLSVLVSLSLSLYPGVKLFSFCLFLSHL